MGKMILDCLKFSQNERDVFLFQINARRLLDIAQFNPREIDRESGIQRTFKTTKSKEITEYIDSE